MGQFYSKQIDRKLKAAGMIEISDRCQGWPAQDESDADKAFVMMIIRDLVHQGVADWVNLGEGIIQLRLATGEVFLLGEESLTRKR